MSLDEFGPDLTNWGRAEMGRIWRNHKSGKLLADEERRLAARMAAHAEWVTWWERAEDLGDVPIGTIEGGDPFRFVAVQAAVDGLIAEGGANRDRRWGEYYQDARAAHARLHSDGLSDEAARAEIVYAYFGVLADVRRRQTAIEDAIKDTVARFRQVLQRLAAGERATDIFPE